jgi:hypothetical protein
VAFREAGGKVRLEASYALPVDELRYRRVGNRYGVDTERGTFLLDSALSKAAEVMADRRLFLLDDEQWAAFLAALDAPPQPTPRLERLLKEPSALEKAPNP